MVMPCGRRPQEAKQGLVCDRYRWIRAFLPYLGAELAAKLASELVCRCELASVPPPRAVGRIEAISPIGTDGIAPPLAAHEGELGVFSSLHYSFWTSSKVRASWDEDAKRLTVTFQWYGPS
jgi:hypothetical protein